MMETLPQFALKGEKKLAGGEASGTTPFASPPVNKVICAYVLSESAMDGGFTQNAPSGRLGTPHHCT